MQINLKTFDSFFFDFDGLLVNTESLHFEAYSEMVQCFGFELSWDLKTYLSHALISPEHLKTSVLNEVKGLKSLGIDWQDLRSKKQDIFQQKLLAGSAQFMPGASDFLKVVKQAGKRLAVVTNSPKNHIEIIRKQLPELSLIDLWITRESYEKPKPNPECYLTAKAHLKSNQGIGFEDSPKGIYSVQEAGLFPVMIKPSIYPNFSDLPENLTTYDSFSPLLQNFTTS